MKKVIFLFAALLAIFSGVAAVSAYEGHIIDVKAHVENAIGVATPEMNMGTVFPQEVVENNVTFGLSSSFKAATQTRISSLNYKLYWELKPLVAGAGPPYTSGTGTYFQPMSPFLTVSDGDPSDFNDTFIPGPWALPTQNLAVQFGAGELSKIIPQPVNGPDGDLCDTIHLKLNVPVFRAWYNALTDAGNPLGTIQILEPSQYNVAHETVCGATEVDVPWADLGINIKIQVIGFVPHTNPPGQS